MDINIQEIQEDRNLGRRKGGLAQGASDSKVGSGNEPTQTDSDYPIRPAAPGGRSDDNCRSVGLRSEDSLSDGLSDGRSVSHTARDKASQLSREAAVKERRKQEGEKVNPNTAAVRLVRNRFRVE